MKKIIVSITVAGLLAALSIVVVRPAGAQEQIDYDYVAPTVDFHYAALNLVQLEARLHKSPAMGFLTKLWLTNNLTEILEGVTRHYEGSGEHGIETLKARFLALTDETAAKLKDSDPSLSNTIASSRDAIWEALLRRR